MRKPHYNYSLQFVPCVHQSFLIFVSSELMSAKYEECNINKLWNKKEKRKNNHIYSIKITTKQKLPHVLSY